MSIDTDYKVLRDVLIDHQPKGWAIEFGVYSGYSLAMIATHMPVIGLDSFEGLPEDWREGFPKGAFNDGGILDHAQGHLANAMIVPGLFEDTLPELVARGLPPLGLIHIDCDLYSSTVTALEWLVDHLREGTLVVFDEYEGADFDDEKRAWEEFTDGYGIWYEEIGRGNEERAFKITGVA